MSEECSDKQASNLRSRCGKVGSTDGMDLSLWRASIANETGKTGRDISKNSFKKWTIRESEAILTDYNLMYIYESWIRELVDKYNFTCAPKTLLAGAPRNTVAEAMPNFKNCFVEKKSSSMTFQEQTYPWW